MEIKLYVSSRQSVKLFIDKKIVINKNDSLHEDSATVKLSKNKWYPVTIEYDNIDFRGSNLKIYWSWTGVNKSSVGREYLMHSEYNNKKANRTLVLGF